MPRANRQKKRQLCVYPLLTIKHTCLDPKTHLTGGIANGHGGSSPTLLPS
jgi:hypothetical protein